MKSIVDHVQLNGFKFGLVRNVYHLSSADTFLRTHSSLVVCLCTCFCSCCGCLQYTDAGMYTCKKGERDHKIPGSYGHYEQDAQTYADWGVECKSLPVSHWKFDWVETFVFKSNMFIIS